MVHVGVLFFLDVSRSTSVGVRAHYELLLGDLHGLGELLHSGDPTLPRMWRWSPRWLRLWRLVFDELLRWKPVIQDFHVPWRHLLTHLINISDILLIWSLVWNLVIIWLFVRRWLQSECGFAPNFSSPIWNLRALKLILLGWVPYLLTDQVIHILLLFEAPKL